MARPNFQQKPTHQTGTGKGEEKGRNQGGEAGRYDIERTGAGRRAGKATPRTASGIVTQGTVDPSSPYLPPP
jgi:hypothetical protein